MHQLPWLHSLNMSHYDLLQCFVKDLLVAPKFPTLSIPWSPSWSIVHHSRLPNHDVFKPFPATLLYHKNVENASVLPKAATWSRAKSQLCRLVLGWENIHCCLFFVRDFLVSKMRTSTLHWTSLNHDWQDSRPYIIILNRSLFSCMLPAWSQDFLTIDLKNSIPGYPPYCWHCSPAPERFGRMNITVIQVEFKSQKHEACMISN